MTLREVILLLRSSSDFTVPTSIADCKAYGLTIDKALMDFDSFERRKPSNIVNGFVPAFFFPSYLLKRMYRYLPVQSEDYRKSFISSVSSPFLPSSGKDSNLVQKTIAHFRAMGIDDSDFIISRLRDEMFVQTVNGFTNAEDAEVFIESDVNKLIEAKSREIDKNSRQISAIEGKLRASVNKSSITATENENLKADKETSEQHIKSLAAAIDKLKSQVKKGLKANRNVPVQEFLPFPDEKDRKIQELEEQVAALSASEKKREDTLKKNREKRISEYKESKIKIWQQKPKNLLWLLLGIGTVALISAFYALDWKVSNFFAEHSGKKVKVVLTGILGIISYVFSVYLIKEIQSRNTDFKNINEYRNQIKVPDDI